MQIAIALNSGTYTVDLTAPDDISIPLEFDAANPVCWGAPTARSQIYRSGDFIGNTRQGGSCNVAEYHLIPHCQGTHIEGVGHISHQFIPIHQLRQVLIPATLVTILPQPLVESGDRYVPDCYGSDLAITRAALETSLANQKSDFLQGLIVRTLPNAPTKKTRDYSQALPPFFSLDAIEYIVDLGVQHLLVDTPSVDRIFDGGHLSVHRHFWGVAPGSHDVAPASASPKTIVETIFVPDAIADGPYLANLQFPAFVADTAPCRPLLYKVSRQS